MTFLDTASVIIVMISLFILAVLVDKGNWPRT
jgi:hypothetical protein